VKVVFYVNANLRGQKIGQAVVAGCARHGQPVELRRVHGYGGPEADVAVFYGLWPPLKRIREEYVAAGRKSVLVDLGYWGRIWNGDKMAGYHRFVVNGLHATHYFQRIAHPADRFGVFGLEPRPFRRDGEFILLCGMSGKAAWVYGLEPEAWERAAVDELRRHTGRPIVYRPKPSWKEARPIPGTTFAPDAEPLGARRLAGCWAVVTHHGNSALDALLAGVPAFTTDGIAAALAGRDLAGVESPPRPDAARRDQLLFDAAYTQFRTGEIADGTAWGHLREEGLI
jgi:hypothetical protein